MWLFTAAMACSAFGQVRRPLAPPRPGRPCASLEERGTEQAGPAGKQPREPSGARAPPPPLQAGFVANMQDVAPRHAGARDPPSLPAPPSLPSLHPPPACHP